MSKSKLPTLSEGLADLVARFERFGWVANGEYLLADHVALPITGKDGRLILQILKILRHMATVQERELGSLRLLVGDIAAPTGEPKGDNIIRPNFGRPNDGKGVP